MSNSAIIRVNFNEPTEEEEYRQYWNEKWIEFVGENYEQVAEGLVSLEELEEEFVRRVKEDEKNASQVLAKIKEMLDQEDARLEWSRKKKAFSRKKEAQRRSLGLKGEQ
jgi:hypothetical protein